ncbi:Virulence regulon transcriptional activator VirF [compost metagenome]
MFARNYQTTPIDYIIRRRLDYSCTLLRDDAVTIQQAAMESGFSDQNYYARQFKKVFRCTPTEYRERQKLLHS